MRNLLQCVLASSFLATITACSDEVSKRASVGDDASKDTQVSETDSPTTNSAIQRQVNGTSSTTPNGTTSTQSLEISRAGLEAICAHKKYGTSERATRDQGDFDGNGLFDFRDVVIFMPHYTGNLTPVIDGCPFIEPSP